MLQVDVQLYQSPIYLPPCTSTQDDIALSGCARITSSDNCRIPGLEVLLINTIERRSETGGKWSPCEINETFTTTVLEGDHWVQAGTTDFEFSLKIKRTIPYTRTTHFDRIVHTLYAFIPNDPPSYDRPTSRNANGSKPLKRSLLPRLKKKKSPDTVFHPISQAPVLAISAEPVHVYGPKSYLDQVNTSSWYEQTQISSAGVDVALRSEEEYVTLGSPYPVEITLNDLPPTLTLHGWNMGMGGDDLPNPTSEGAIRSWVYERPIHILSDLHGLGDVPTPVYSPKDVGTLPETKAQDIEVGMDLIQRINLPHMVSISKSKAGFMRPSVLHKDILGSRIQEHWSRTGGLCACFDEAEGRGNKCVRMGSVEKGRGTVKLP